jgi:putative glutamine amidotransferase
MSLPLIGITTYGRDEKNKFYLPAEYLAVRRAGGLPVLLPPGEAPQRKLVSHIDGLLLSGGGDVDPAIYRGLLHETLYMVDPERDLALAREVVASGLPTLGICRGTQILNVSLGGTLIEHLPDVVSDRVPHRLPPREPTRHPVSLKAGLRLAGIMEQIQLLPVSWHHQAIRTAALAGGCRASSRWTIEAVEMNEHPWLIAVQWHPELTAAEDPAQQLLFDAFVKAAAKRHRRTA